MKRIIAGGIFICAIIIGSVIVNADEISDLELQVENKEAECDVIKREILDLEREKKNLSGEIIQYNSELNKLCDEINALEESIAIITTELNEAQEREDLQREAFYERLRTLYENGTMTSLEVMLDSGDIMTAEKKLNYIRQISEYDRGIFDQAFATKAEIEEKKNGLDNRVNDYNGKKIDFDNRIQENNEHIKSVNDKIKEKKSALIALNKEKNQINARLNKMTFSGKLFSEGEKYLGFPYVFGGSTPETSFDCSGFVCWVYTNSGTFNLPRTSAQGIYDQCEKVSAEEVKPGDLVFFEGTYNTGNAVSHVGIYAGDGKMLHCGDPIQYAPINCDYWKKHFYAYGRLVR